ncbi:TPA: C40 family peptidase [Streptococcus pyogenes]|uniref:C40 family peptidase n=1 Tax=Anaerococcus TaxID=165779 RepID=UPI0003013513|nr:MULTISPECIES: C40 family peptidase [Anaerococcus]HEQ3735795.1 C40 family peptidase [Streptococcus pyogenes]HEQ3988653.1 C40 family peptidase [Streptococcus pyogenes]
MKKEKGKINPRDVPKSKLILEKKNISSNTIKNKKDSPILLNKNSERENSTFMNEKDSYRQVSEVENYDNIKKTSSHFQELDNKYIPNINEKSDKEKIQRKRQEKVYREKYKILDNLKQDNEVEDKIREERIKKENDRVYENRISNFKKSSNHISKNGIKNKDKLEVYDPLSKDLDNDGVIDRYDMDFRDSNISYRDTSDDEKYFSKYRNKRFLNDFRKNKEQYQSDKQENSFQDKSISTKIERSNVRDYKGKKFRAKSLYLTESEMDNKNYQKLKTGKNLKEKCSVDLNNKNKIIDNNKKEGKRANFNLNEKYTRTKKESSNVKEGQNKFKEDKLKEEDKLQKNEEKISKLHSKKAKKEKDLVKDNKKAKKGGLENPLILASAMASNYLYSGKEDNAGIDVSYKVSRSTELIGKNIRRNRRKKALKTKRKLEKLDNKIHKKESRLLFEKNFEELKKSRVYQNTNKLNRFFMKKKFQKDFRKKQEVSLKNRIKKSITNMSKKTAEVLKNKGYKNIFIVLCILGLFFMLFKEISNIGSITSGITSNVMATSYLSKKEVLSDVNNEFSSYEYALQDEIDSIKENYPNYDEYHIKGDPVGHDVHELFSYLTARYGEIKSTDEIKKELKKLFNQMYKKEYTSKTITKYDKDGNPYTYKILTLTITKKSIDKIAKEEFAIYETNMAHYLSLLENQGNMGDYFGSGYGDLGDIVDNPNFGNSGIEFDDVAVRRLFGEAEKHIGKRYVFGASGPRNFDCSGFVCWSFTKSGVKNMPRTTAWRIYTDYCNPVSPSQAKPGDIIFFKGTYNSGTPISHVGIYAGNGMMIHAGDPIQYANINTRYWKEHFYAFGRPR